MAVYTFSDNLLSAASTGSPTLLNTSLSASNLLVVVDGLSAAKGLAYNTISIGNSGLTAATLSGNSFRINGAYHNADFGLMNLDGSTTIFTFNSGSTAQTSISGATFDASTAEQRRKHLLGF